MSDEDGYMCDLCWNDFFAESPRRYRESMICESCWRGLAEEIKKSTNEPKQKEETQQTCADCGLILTGWRSLYTIEGTSYCYMCWKRKQDATIVRCADCGKVLPSIALKYTIDGKTYCGPCGEKRQRRTSYGTFSNGARAGCAQCGKQPETVCTHCNKPFCSACYMQHIGQTTGKKEEPAYTYTYRVNFEAGEMDFDTISELLRRYSRGGFGFSSNPNPGPTTNKQSSSSSSTSTRYVSAEAREAFKTLGIAESSTVEQIEKTYKRKAKLYHPETVAYILEGERYVPSPHSDTIKTQEMVKLNKAKDIALKHTKGK